MKVIRSGSSGIPGQGLGYSAARGYQYSTGQAEIPQGRKEKFSLGGFFQRVLTEGVTEALSSAGSFGLGKIVGAVKRGIQGRKNRVAGGKGNADVYTGIGYDAGDRPVRIDGNWTENDMKQALLGHPPKGLGSPDIHHGGQMPRGSLHEILPREHRSNPALHRNLYNQGVTAEMRLEDRKLHWWYRAREQGADELLPDWIYD